MGNLVSLTLPVCRRREFTASAIFFFFFCLTKEYNHAIPSEALWHLASWSGPIRSGNRIPGHLGLEHLQVEVVVAVALDDSVTAAPPELR